MDLATRYHLSSRWSFRIKKFPASLGSLSTRNGLKKKLKPRKDTFRPFFFDVQSDKNPFFEVFKVPKPKALRLISLMRLFVASNFALE